jgi:hypothetical protein
MAALPYRRLSHYWPLAFPCSDCFRCHVVHHLSARSADGDGKAATPVRARVVPCVYRINLGVRKLGGAGFDRITNSPEAIHPKVLRVLAPLPSYDTHGSPSCPSMDFVLGFLNARILIEERRE